MQVLIDGSNMWYRAYTGAMHLEAPGGPVTIMSFMLRKLCRRYGRSKIILCWDHGDSGRKLIASTYKEGRPTAEGVWDHIPRMKEMVSALGFESAWCPGFEADDVIASLAKQYRGGETYIVSTDKDFYQLVDDKVFVIRPERKYKERVYPEEKIGPEEATSEFGLPPNKLALLKAFKGDSSDNIAKLPLRFSKKFKEAFYQLIKRSETIDEIYAELSWFSQKQTDVLLDFKEQAIINLKLVTMKMDLEPVFYTEWVRENVNARFPGREWFDDLCEKMKIKNLYYDDFI